MRLETRDKIYDYVLKYNETVLGKKEADDEWKDIENMKKETVIEMEKETVIEMEKVPSKEDGELIPMEAFQELC